MHSELRRFEGKLVQSRDWRSIKIRGRDEVTSCDRCGWPLDRGDRYWLSEILNSAACSKSCREWLDFNRS